MKLKLSIMMLLVSSSLSAFEVNTHQAITRCAISTDCGTEGVQNLNAFVKNALLTKIDYKKELFENYGYTYFDYAKGDDFKDGKDFRNYQIAFKDSRYLDLIEAGVVLEDSVYHNNNDPKQDADFGGDGRFNNHFYAAQFNSKIICAGLGAITGSLLSLINPTVGRFAAKEGAKLALLMQTNHALCMGYGERTDNITWALKENVILSVGRKNDYNIHNAFEYYRKSFEGKKIERLKYQAKLFASIGFMIHMIQDLHSPAHVRDGSHPWGDYLEIYGRYNSGFNLRNGKLNSTNNSAIRFAIQSFDMKKIMLVDNRYSSYQDFFTHEANWVSKNFFSEAHMDTDTATNNETGSGLDFDTITDRDTIFDAYNPHLAKSETTEEAIPNADTAVFGDLWNYIKTNGNVASERGKIIQNTVAIIEKGYLFDSERMMAVVSGKSTTNYNDYDKTPLEHTAINVMPRAVASSQAFINFFFRGQLEATLNENNESITIKNISNPKLVSSPDLLTFKSGSNNIKVLYLDENGDSKELMVTGLTQDLAIDEEFIITGVAEKLNDPNITLGKDKKIIVLFDGQIGESRGLDDYNIHAKGLSVAYASTRVINADILFSFDRSGSMGSSIEVAKSSAISILDDIIGIDNDSVSIEIDAFSTSANVLLAYENDIANAKTVISGVFSGGSTALYDAIKLAGDNAVRHKIDNQIQKSIIILYTDGIENKSSASKSQAVTAISKANASEIDDVFLIFVGNNFNGISDLKDIANQAGRKFMNVSDVNGLKDAIDTILREQ